MISTKSELKDDVRQMSGYTSTQVLSTDGLDTAYRTAQRHIRVKKSLGTGYDWYGSDKEEAREALFWFTCLFVKVQTGELDSQDLQVGAINHKTLLAKSDDEVTVWYRNAISALQSIKSANIIRSTTPARTDREYETDTFKQEQGGSGGTQVDGNDL
jgi:hypothetical protein